MYLLIRHILLQLQQKVTFIKQSADYIDDWNLFLGFYAYSWKIAM